MKGGPSFLNFPSVLTCHDLASLPPLVMPQLVSLMLSDYAAVTRDLRNKTRAIYLVHMFLSWFNQSIKFSLYARSLSENSLECVAMVLKIYCAWEEPSPST